MARESVRGVAAADLVALLAEQPSDTLKDLVVGDGVKIPTSGGIKIPTL